jgi:beta-galactosidase
LNGEEVDTKKVSDETKLTTQFVVPYKEGELTAVGFKNGFEVARQSLKTAGNPSQLKITAEADFISASSDDLAYFNVEVLDDNGVLVPNAEIPVLFEIEGNCTLQAVGNGNPIDMKSFQQPKVNTFRGKCQIIIRSCSESDKIKVTAKSNGLKSGTSTVEITNI